MIAPRAMPWRDALPRCATLCTLLILLPLSLSGCRSTSDDAPLYPEGGTPGCSQSPININTKAADTGRHSIHLYYGATHENVVHKEHTIEVDYDEGSQLEFDGVLYDLKQFHFHTPSEHLIDGVRFPLEVHLVHATEEGALLVVGALFNEGEESVGIDTFLDDVPEDLGRFESDKQIDLGKLAPVQPRFYTYDGSLTTPPYTEGVRWLILRDALTASAEQIATLRRLEGENARAEQPMHGREVEEL